MSISEEQSRLVKTYYKLFGHINLIKAKKNKDGITTSYYLFGFLPFAKKRIVSDTTSKFYFLGLCILTTRNVYKKEKQIFYNESFFVKYYENVIYQTMFISKLLGSPIKYEKIFPLYLYLRLFFTRKVTVPNIDVHTTTYCSLKCKDCSHKIPYYTKEQQHVMTFEEFKTYLDAILKNVDKIYNLLLLGGEPLLNKELPRIIEYADSKEQIVNVRILSNGTIIPSDELITTLTKTKKTVFNMSNYSVNKEILTIKMSQIIDILKENNIKYFHANDEDFYWTTQPELQIDKAGKLSKEEIQSNFLKCDFRRCHLMAGDGYFYPCALSKFIRNNGYNMSSEDCINLQTNEDKRKEFIKFYTKDYYQVCECCNMENYGQPILAAIQISNDEGEF